jgi:voltage-gated potassium channel
MQNVSIFRIFLSNFVVYILLFIVLIVIGVVGYVYLQDYTPLEALYMTIITIGSVGYAETKPLDDTGRIFTIFLILANLVILTLVISKISKFLFDSDIRKLFKKINMEKSIMQLKDHIIICGCGQNGSETIKELKKSHLEYVVIDRLPIVSSPEIKFFINDDATKDEVLIRAGIKNAQALITTLPSDAENIFVVLTAKELNPDLKIISRASNDSSIKKLKSAGANNVIMPDKLGGVHMANLVLIPDVKEFMDVMSTYQNNGNKIVELIPTRLATLSDLNIWNSTGCLLLGIKKLDGDYIVNPKHDYKIDLSDKLIVFGNDDEIKKLIPLIDLFHN